MPSVFFRYMLRMSNVYGVSDAFLICRITQYGFAQSFYTRSDIQFLAHLFKRKVSVCTSFRQPQYSALVFTVSLDAHIVIQRQTPYGNKSFGWPWHQQYIKQIGESSPGQSARCGGQSQLFRLWKSIHHLLVGLRYGMVCLVNHYQRWTLFHFLIVFRKPLYRHYLYARIIR